MRAASNCQALVAMLNTKTDLKLRLTWCVAEINMEEYGIGERKSSKQQK